MAIVKVVLGVLAGLLGWTVVASLLDRLVRAAWPAYAAALPAFDFTGPMLASRLATGAAATLVAGAVAGAVSTRVARAGAGIGANARTAAIATGIALLVFFVPVHAQLWSRFPAWYHALFLGSLLPLALLGARVVSRRAPAAAATPPG